jgi:hypothetical protein
MKPVAMFDKKKVSVEFSYSIKKWRRTVCERKFIETELRGMAIEKKIIIIIIEEMVINLSERKLIFSFTITFRSKGLTCNARRSFLEKFSTNE